MLVSLFVILYICVRIVSFFFFSSRRRHTSWPGDWSSDVCSSDLRCSDLGPRLEPQGDHRRHQAARADARIAVVISNRADAPGLDHAIGAGIETLIINHKAYATREDYRSEERRVGEGCGRRTAAAG